MVRHDQETDYFVPILAPYVQWVNAYRDLIFSLYGKHKTVKRTWKAFKDSVPGVEQRLEFGVFEQILLFSLFLSECDESGEQGHRVRKVSKTTRSAGDCGECSHDSGSDKVIQELRNVSAERDRALWNAKHLQENVVSLTAQKEDLDGQVKSLEVRLGELLDELRTANENPDRVNHELGKLKTENAALRREATLLSEKRRLLEHRIQELLKKSDRPVPARIESSYPLAVKVPKVRQNLSQMVVRWAGHGSGQMARVEVIQNSEIGGTHSKRIAGWNAQLSKDGYYRLYRKIKGRVHSIYIGKELDIDKAHKRIAEKERQLLGLNSATSP